MGGWACPHKFSFLPRTGTLRSAQVVVPGARDFEVNDLLLRPAFDRNVHAKQNP